MVRLERFGAETMAKSQVRWTDEEKALLAQIGGTMNSHDLVRMFPGHTREGIRMMRQRLGISMAPGVKSEVASINRAKADPSLWSKSDQSLTLDDLDPLVVQVLLGSILGDGCVRRRSRNSRNFVFSEGHCFDQWEYTEWKRLVFSVFSPTRCASRQRRCGRVQREFSTGMHPVFEEIRRDVYVDGHKHLIPEWIAKRIDATGLLIWYLDDGTVGTPKEGKNKRGRHLTARPSIEAKGWRLQDLEMACAIINSRLSTGLRVMTYKNRAEMGGRVLIPAASRDILFPIWKDTFEKSGIPDCMAYKINPHRHPRLHKSANLDSPEASK